MMRFIEFLFFRWKCEVIERGIETWTMHSLSLPNRSIEYQRNYIDYKYTNKFDGSVKIKRKYLNK